MAKLGKAEEENYITGDRMATFMLYLSEVSDVLNNPNLMNKVLQTKSWFFEPSRLSRLPKCRGILQGFRVKEGLSCVLFCAVALRKTQNLALPWLKNHVWQFWPIPSKHFSLTLFSGAFMWLGNMVEGRCDNKFFITAFYEFPAIIILLRWGREDIRHFPDSELLFRRPKARPCFGTISSAAAAPTWQCFTAAAPCSLAPSGWRTSGCARPPISFTGGASETSTFNCPKSSSSQNKK